MIGMMPRRRWQTLVLGFVALTAAACSRPPRLVALRMDVTPSVELSPATPVAGLPMVVTYRWRVGSSFRPPARDQSVFVHLLSADGTSLVNDDHAPPASSSRWTPGSEYTYDRVLFTPRQFPGRLELRLGLFDPESGERPELHGQSRGLCEYRVASVDLQRDPDSQAPRFGRGFYGSEADPGAPFRPLHWMGRQGRVSLHNSRADSLLVVRAWTVHRSFDVSPTLTVLARGRARRHVINDGETFVIGLKLEHAELGRDEWLDVDLEMDREFLPPPPDTRRLSLCVEGAALVPWELVTAKLAAAVLRADAE
jgi:hypothetical protein